MRLKMLYIAVHESISYADLSRIAFLDFIKRFEKEHGKITQSMVEPLKHKSTSKPTPVHLKASIGPQNVSEGIDSRGFIRDFMENPTES